MYWATYRHGNVSAEILSRFVSPYNVRGRGWVLTLWGRSLRLRFPVAAKDKNTARASWCIVGFHEVLRMWIGNGHFVPSDNCEMDTTI
jgi:hypothetical protein